MDPWNRGIPWSVWCHKSTVPWIHDPSMESWNSNRGALLQLEHVGVTSGILWVEFHAESSVALERMEWQWNYRRGVELEQWSVAFLTFYTVQRVHTIPLRNTLYS